MYLNCDECFKYLSCPHHLKNHICGESGLIAPCNSKLQGSIFLKIPTFHFLLQMHEKLDVVLAQLLQSSFPSKTYFQPP